MILEELVFILLYISGFGFSDYLVNYLNSKGKSIVLETKGDYKEELVLLNKLKE